jgi:hypothetical protein
VNLTTPATAIALQLRQTLGLTYMAAESPEGGDPKDALWDDEDKEA